MLVLIDMLWGSCGKGKFAYEFAERYGLSTAISVNGPNAGHTTVVNGEKVVFKCLPSAALSPNCKRALIGPSSIMDLSRFHSERARLDADVVIHENATLLTSEMVSREAAQSQIQATGSTAQGTGVARCDKIMRKSCCIRDHVSAVVATGIGSTALVHTDGWLDLLDAHHKDAILECPQGTLLSLDFGHNYPYVTSRNITSDAMMAEIGYSGVRTVVGVVRPYPIRVGHGNGNSGPMGADELTWDVILKRCGAPDSALVDVLRTETTTVTGRQRRVAEMSPYLLKRAARLNKPDKLVLNFAQYIDWDVQGCSTWNELPKRVREFIGQIEDVTRADVIAVGYGPGPQETIWL